MKRKKIANREVIRLPFEHEGIEQFDKEELKKIIEDGSRRIIDVRTKEEYESGHIPGVPLRPLQELEDWAHEISSDESYIFICRSGARSQKVSQVLKERGIKDVANFNGGMLTWDGPVES